MEPSSEMRLPTGVRHEERAAGRPVGREPGDATVGDIERVDRVVAIGRDIDPSGEGRSGTVSSRSNRPVASKTSSLDLARTLSRVSVDRSRPGPHSGACWHHSGRVRTIMAPSWGRLGPPTACTAGSTELRAISSPRLNDRPRLAVDEATLAAMRSRDTCPSRHVGEEARGSVGLLSPTSPVTTERS